MTRFVFTTFLALVAFECLEGKTTFEEVSHHRAERLKPRTLKMAGRRPSNATFQIPIFIGCQTNSMNGYLGISPSNRGMQNI
jgi:hypothetical protein